MDDPYPSALPESSGVELMTMDMNALWALAAVFILLLLSALMSAAEVSFFSINQKEIDALDESRKRRVQKLLAHPKKLLATILIAGNSLNIGIVITFVFLTDYFFLFTGVEGWTKFAIQVAVISFLILLFAEVIPKVYATYRPLPIIRLMAVPLRFLNRLFSWFSTPLILSIRFLDARTKKNQAPLSAGELSAVIDMTRDKTVTDEEKKIWKGVIEFGQISVKETMKPRIDVVAIEVSATFADVIGEIVNTGYSRVPVYRENFDNIEGVLYIKDLLPWLDNHDGFEWQTLVRPPFYVPENKKIDDLLKEFQAKKMHMAIVVDEFGGSSGIITLEDVIEEIVGEINDEFDDDEVVYSKLDENNYVFEGKTTLINLCRLMDMEYAEIEEFAKDADTLAGLILELNDILPDRGQVLDCNHLRFTVESVDKKRIKRVKVTRISNEDIIS